MNEPQVSQRRPATISELTAQVVRRNHQDIVGKSFKGLLRMAETNFKRGKELAKNTSDGESAFVALANAAFLVLEILPDHPHYTVILSTTQRRNLINNGGAILDLMSDLKIAIERRYAEWEHRREGIEAEDSLTRIMRLVEDAPAITRNRAPLLGALPPTQLASDKSANVRPGPPAHPAQRAPLSRSFTDETTRGAPFSVARTNPYDHLMSQHQRQQGYVPSAGQPIIQTSPPTSPTGSNSRILSRSAGASTSSPSDYRSGTTHQLEGSNQPSNPGKTATRVETGPADSPHRATNPGPMDHLQYLTGPRYYDSDSGYESPDFIPSPLSSEYEASISGSETPASVLSYLLMSPTDQDYDADFGFSPLVEGLGIAADSPRR